MSTGNCIIAQSGGPTAVINSSLCGLIKEAMGRNNIGNIYGALYGVEGILQEQFIDLKKQEEQIINGLCHTPGAALGSGRYKLKEKDYGQLLHIFKRHNIRYFFYIGGNDSMDTVKQISQLAKTANYDLQVIGVPKTVDNDLPVTDHCPGYGSAAKYIATIVRETGIDLQGMRSKNKVTILEAMGRDTGWLAAAAVLAKRTPEESPHLIYLPEQVFSLEQFLADIEAVYQELGYVYVVVSEGIKDAAGKYISAETTNDMFGHQQLGGGLAIYLKNSVEKALNLKTRYIVPATSQRSSLLYASLTDIEEAYLVGRAAVRLACEGRSGLMVTLEREPGAIYTCHSGYADVEQVANRVKYVPGQWLSEGQTLNQEFINYALPLIAGKVQVPEKDGLPDYVCLKKELYL